MRNYNTDDYGQVVNGEDTYAAAAEDLIEQGAVVLNWTDGEGSLYNILLVLAPPRVGAPGGLVDNSGRKLWVGVAGRGCFGFGLAGLCSPGYAAEKLGLDWYDAQRIAALVTGVRTVLTGALA